MSKAVNRRSDDAQSRDQIAQLHSLLDTLSRRGTRPLLSDIDQCFALSRQVAARIARLQRRDPDHPLLPALYAVQARSERLLQAPPPRMQLKKIWPFWLHDWPALVWRQRRLLALSAAVMLLGLVLGALQTWINPDIGAQIVGEQVAGAVQSGQLWTDPIAEQGRHSAASAFIFTNNIRVSVMAFAGGILWTFGALALLFFNGLQLGATLAYTGLNPQVQLGLLDFISAHGPVEMSLICIAGAAGMWMGSALLDPGEAPRSLVLRLRAREAVQILLGAAPFFVAIGLVEGFVSPGAWLPTWLKLSLGLSLWMALALHIWRSGRTFSTH